jgi:tRNA(fMet)-specific endonuclease VapC
VRPRFVLDTNICIYLMKRFPPEVAERFAACFVGDVVMSAVTYAELAFGVACSGERRAQNAAALAALVEDILVVPFDIAAGRAYAAVRLAVRDRRRDALDTLIAAHAVALDATLVTNNTADFEAFPGLRLANWVSEGR